MAKYDFDLIVIGSGGAGITAALLGSGLGKRVAMLDKKRFGGECTWTGCVPSKALIRSARISHYIAEAGRYGLAVKGKYSIGYDSVMKNARGIVESVYKGESARHFSKMGITAVENAGISFSDPHSLTVNGKMMTSDKFVITTGSSPLVPAIEGMGAANILTNETIFSLNKLPASMIILGAGPIGVEMASALNRLGVKITLVEMAPVILSREDLEMAELLTQSLEREGVAILTGAAAVRVSGAKRIELVCKIGGRERRITAERMLVAVGRRPNTDGLALEKAGVEYDRKGIAVNRYLRTSAKNIYAAGDVVGAYQFSHVANYQAIIAASNALLPIKRKVVYQHVPWCVFTDPELARSGLTEAEARERYGGIRTYRVLYEGIDRAATDRAQNGLAKFICGRRGKILGIHILGERAGELLHEAHAAKSLGIPLHRLNSVIHAYPTYNDIMRKGAREAYIDKLQRSLIIRLIKLFRKAK
jgi:pyruvate/2-oxoglutarate dehydrogenase complex dihydrolipoamide dehydrogenase (E3) component